MEIVGSIDPSEIPLGLGLKRDGIWTNLARQVIQAHEEGRVLVLKFKDDEERKRAINGMAEPIRVAGYKRRFITVPEDDGMRLYCQLEDKTPTVVTRPIKRIRIGKRQEA